MERKAFVSNENVSKDLFKNPWLNRLSRTHTAIPVTLFTLYAIGLLYYTIQVTALPTPTIVALFFAGMVFFTFVEYAIHRWVYHPPTQASEQRLRFTYTIHGVHHDYPKDKQRLAMPPVLSVVIGTFLLLLFRLVLQQYAFAFLSGFMLGYATYLTMHYMVHIYRAPSNFFKYLWVNHAIHHYNEDGVMFGVTSPLWDYVFGTLPRKKTTQQPKVVAR